MDRYAALLAAAVVVSVIIILVSRCGPTILLLSGYRDAHCLCLTRSSDVSIRELNEIIYDYNIASMPVGNLHFLCGSKRLRFLRKAADNQTKKEKNKQTL